MWNVIVNTVNFQGDECGEKLSFVTKQEAMDKYLELCEGWRDYYVEIMVNDGIEDRDEEEILNTMEITAPEFKIEYFGTSVELKIYDDKNI